MINDKHQHTCINTLMNIHVFSGCGLPAEEDLQVSCDPLSFALVSDHTAELIQGAVHHLETPTIIHHPEHKQYELQLHLLHTWGSVQTACCAARSCA